MLGGFRVLNHDRVPKEGPVILAPNHVSFADPPAIACASHRPLRFMAQAGLFDVPIFGWLIRKLGSFPVRRGEADTTAIRIAIDALEKGSVVLVFPEGRRGDGVRLLPSNKGVTLLASRSGAKIVPIGIAGTLKRLPKGAKLPKMCRVTVNFGEPFTFAELSNEVGREEAKRQFPLVLMEKIGALLEEAGQPARD